MQLHLVNKASPTELLREGGTEGGVYTLKVLAFSDMR